MTPIRETTVLIRTGKLQFQKWTGAVTLCLAMVFVLAAGPLSAQDRSLSGPDRAGQERYIDTRTGHLYVKRADGNYDEFTRKGIYFKTVPSGLPLLLKGESVHPVSNACYLLYSRKRYQTGSRFKLLPVQAPHPAGWSLETAFVDLDSRKRHVDKISVVVHQGDRRTGFDGASGSCY